jgi:spermidine synthase
VVERKRSFLGPLRVVDLADRRVLTHGRIQHGAQFRAPERRMVPGAYYGPATGIARAIGRRGADGPLRIGVVGLGAGTIAAYGRPGDSLTFYELDDNVVAVANRDFSFLRESPARIEIVKGDGRLSLSREPSRRFDVLVLDAFSSDSVPVHLLTREAFAVYARHLAVGGVLIANASNRYLAVDRVVRASARSIGLSCRTIETPTNVARGESHALWVVAARESWLRELATTEAPASSERPEELWTDRRASLWSILR